MADASQKQEAQQSRAIEKAERAQAREALDAKIAKHAKTIRVLVISEAIVSLLAFGVGAMSIFASLSGVADQAAADTGVSAEMLGGNSAGTLMLLGGILLVIVSICGFLAVILGKNTVDDPSYSAAFTVMSFAALVASGIALIVSALNGSFYANMSVIVINIFISLSCVRTGMKMRGMYLERKSLA